ncbi:MAG: hypothetical protein ABSF95_22020 [Verrucomicrobiota bacterium]|jgi:hypothetical protein
MKRLFSLLQALALRPKLRFVVLLFVGFGLAAPCVAAGAERARVNVILWFDTEDYLLPADDDACKQLAEMLTERGIRATFKVVGEKARVLERRGRRDVIAALRKHAIAYHANFHSVHPTPSEYLADCGLLDGAAEFIRREGGGAADVRRIFSVRTLACYGQPGSSWAPQAIVALKGLGVAPHGVPCYVDEGDHVGLDERPFWYAGALNVYRMGGNCTRMELHDPASVEPAKSRVSAIAERLRREDGGGLISIYYHPCEWVHREFWDGVNFRRGANPPREQWQAPPQRTAQETAAAFRRFGEYIDHIRSLPNLGFVTAADLPLLYPDAVRAEETSQGDLAQIASRLLSGAAKGVDFLVLGRRAYSVADQFELLAVAVGKLSAGEKLPFPLRARGLLGPDSPPPAPGGKSRLPWPAFRDTAHDVLDFIQTQQRVPSRVFVGAQPVPPAAFLLALAAAYDGCQKHGQLPLAEGVPLESNPEVLPARQVAADTPDLFGGWIIHQEGFRAPKILELARLQAWTLKPALRAGLPPKAAAR